jgi:bifunctional non-homologous end joining protein LigD
MLATPGGKPFTSPDWLFEIKWDGYRCMALVDAGDVHLRTKNGTNCSVWYPEVLPPLAALPGGPHLIDGEACCLDDIGRSDFNALHARAARRKWYAGCSQVTLMAFDLLMHDGEDIMRRPLAERKERLAQLLKDVPPKTVLRVADFPAEEHLYREVVLGLKLEGFVAKRLASTYTPGVVSPDWVKIKRPGWQEGRNWQDRG